MKIERKIIGGANVRRYHMHSGDVVIVARLDGERCVSLTPNEDDQLNRSLHPGAAAYKIATQREMERTE